MKIIILSDVHGNIRYCEAVCKKYHAHPVLQLGDLGVGFLPRSLIEQLPDNFHFFPGNHDNRTEAITYKNCIGEFGDWKGLFFVSGADSVDKDQRTEGIDWWANEELTYKQGQQCIDQWEASKAEVIISHDCPQFIAENYKLIYDRTITRNILDSMINVRKPRMVIFGHHHRPFLQEFKGTEFRGLKIDEHITLDITENNVKVIA
jgi:predicted phosphodiesterase